MAPDEQTHVGALMWFGEKSKERIDLQTLRQKREKEYSHDNLFPIWGVMGVQTSLYDKTKDILQYQQK